MPDLNLQTPGVYINQAEPAVTRAAVTGIAGFVGLAERGPLNFPQTVTSWGQFLEIFGSFTGYSYLAYSVFGFFLNGGRRCRVVRVAHETAASTSLYVVNQNGIAALRVRAISPGAWGRTVSVAVDDRSTNEIDLTALAAEAPAGTTIASLQSVAGLSPLDLVTLIHRDDPYIREDGLPLQSIDYLLGQVTLARALGNTFPQGSTVTGSGFRLRFRCDSINGATQEEVFNDLSQNPRHPRYFVKLINGDRELADFVDRRNQGLSVLVLVEDIFAGAAAESARLLPLPTTQLQGGSDGALNLDARYYTGRNNGDYFRPVPPGASPADAQQSQQVLLGLSALEAVSDVESVAIPDLILDDLYNDANVVIPPQGIVFAVPPSATMRFDNLKLGQQQMLRHCALMGNRFAILDSPRGAAICAGTTSIEHWPEIFGLSPQTNNAALYFPWLRENPDDFEGLDLFIPPCGHVAGLYDFVARERGLGKAPANELLRGVAQFEVALDDAAQSVLNPRGVNCLRVFPNRGARVWGARTLSPNRLWRYVSVRRLYLYMVRQIQTSMLAMVFEPNNPYLRETIVSTLTLFLRQLLQSGALAGVRPEEAFFVKCNDETNPPGAVDNGEVTAVVGFAPASPAEFIVVTVTRTSESVSVQEQPG